MTTRPVAAEHPRIKALDRRIEKAARIVADRTRPVDHPEVREASRTYARLVGERTELLLRLLLDPKSGDEPPESALLRAAREAVPERPWRDDPWKGALSDKEQITDGDVYVTLRRTSQGEKYAVRACGGGPEEAHRDLVKALVLHTRTMAARRRS